MIRQLWSGNGPVDFSGEYVNVEKATLQRIPDPVPPIFFGGSSPAAGNRRIALRGYVSHLG